MLNFFTSDLHFYHKAVIAHCNRPYADVETMNEILVANWNKIVGPRDTIYILGDFSFGNKEDTVALLKTLNGRKHLVSGNHDAGMLKKKEFLACFESVKPLSRIKIEDKEHPDGVQAIILCHYALRVWEKSHYGAWHCYGHSHGSLEDLGDLSLDVGVDNAYKLLGEYRPFTFAELRAIMQKRNWQPVDHHDTYKG